VTEIKLLDLNHDWRQARPSFVEDGKWLISSGYQSFKLSNNSIIPVSDGLITKFNLVKNTINQDISGKSVSDVGCANMFFGFYSAVSGATKVTGVDLDCEYIAMNRFFIKKLGLNNISVKDINAAEYRDISDTVFAFAIIHWIYSCSGFLGSLENVVKHFRSVTSQVLYIEWIDPSDDCIADMLHHLDFNKDLTVQDYSKDNFIKYLRNNFSSVEFLGCSKQSGTREIYRCAI